MFCFNCLICSKEYSMVQQKNSFSFHFKEGVIFLIFNQFKASKQVQLDKMKNKMSICNKAYQPIIDFFNVGLPKEDIFLTTIYVLYLSHHYTHYKLQSFPCWTSVGQSVN